MDVGIFGESQESSDASVVISVAENRSREICISKICSDSSNNLEIFLTADSHSYMNTLSIIADTKPDEILLHDGSRNNVLSKKIENEFGDGAQRFDDLEDRDDNTEKEASGGMYIDSCSNAFRSRGTRIIYISRMYWDQDRGSDLLKKILVGKIDSDLIAKYTVLAGSFCLLRYIENTTGCTFASHSVRLKFCTGSQCQMNIDSRTAASLELISSSFDGNQKDSLFGTINCTKTIVGARLLKSNLLRPLNEHSTLNMRYDFVEFILKNNNIYAQVVELLVQLPDLDRMLNGLALTTKKVDAKSARMAIDTLLMLKKTITISHRVAQVFLSYINQHGNNNNNNNNRKDGGSIELLEAICGALADPSLQEIQETIVTHIDEDDVTREQQQSIHETRHAECFALKRGVSGLLDIARSSYLKSILQIESIAEAYMDELKVPVKVCYGAHRGYYLQVSCDAAKLPAFFIQSIQNKRSISCSTTEIASLNDSARSSIENALTLTHELLQEVYATIRNHTETLFSVADAIALTDMLSSFAHMVGISTLPYVRPNLLVPEDTASDKATTTNAHSNSNTSTQSSTPRSKATNIIDIERGRHPVISGRARVTGRGSFSAFVPNDLSLNTDHCFSIITGPNGSGKTIYIKQVCLLIILAQIGCFVPCVACTITLRDRILARMGTKDDIEHSMSSFYTEMMETAYLLENVTSHSLVIIDELGKSTSNTDGLSIALAVSEALIEKEVYTLFVTHYPQLVLLSDMYPQVSNLHMKTSVDIERNKGIKFLHEIGTGSCEIKSGYGIAMAQYCGFSSALITKAKAKLRLVRNKFPLLMQAPKADKTIHGVSLLLRHLKSLKAGSIQGDALLSILDTLRQRVDRESSDSLLALLDSMRSTQVDGGGSSSSGDGRGDTNIVNVPPPLTLVQSQNEKAEAKEMPNITKLVASVQSVKEKESLPTPLSVQEQDIDWEPLHSTDNLISTPPIDDSIHGDVNKIDIAAAIAGASSKNVDGDDDLIDQMLLGD
jgi:DNA mismatch repair protein MSH4